MALDGGGDIDEIEAAISEQGLGIAVATLDAELAADDVQPLRVAVADRDDPGALDIVPGMVSLPEMTPLISGLAWRMVSIFE